MEADRKLLHVIVYEMDFKVRHKPENSKGLAVIAKARLVVETYSFMTSVSIRRFPEYLRAYRQAQKA
jgi:hypothetical protein